MVAPARVGTVMWAILLDSLACDAAVVAFLQGLQQGLLAALLNV